MSSLALVPAGAGADLRRYEVHSRAEILQLLRALMARRAPITVHFNGGEDFVVSGLLALDPESGALLLDPSADEAANARLLRSQRLTLVSRLDQVRIQFNVPSARRTTCGRLPALQVRIPSSLVRLQRRESYRIAPPMASALNCFIPDPADRSGRHALRIFDISCGGVAVLAGDERLALEAGMVLEGCVLALPGGAEVSFRAEVRNVSRARGGGAGSLRCGLRFLGMPQKTVTLIQRYILRLERDRIART